MQCRVIADAGPIIALCKAKHLNLVYQLFKIVYITEAVYLEVKAGKDSSAQYLQKAIDHKNICVKSPDKAMIDLEHVLDPGEASSISLAIQLESVLLIDEAKGRHFAKQLHISVIGTAGLLILAKKKQLISSVMPVLHEMREKGYWLSNSFIAELAEICEETHLLK